MTTKPTAIERIPKISLENLPGWDSLIAEDQKAIRNEDRLLAEDLYELGKRRLSIGKRWLALKLIMKQKRIFVAYIRARGWSSATVYRAIDIYQEANTILPSPVMQVALMRGTDRVNASLVKAFPPPKTSDVVEIGKYLDKIAKKEKASSATEPNDDAALAEEKKRECFNFIRTRWASLPASMTKREKTAWMNDLRGMTLTLQGISNNLTIEASAIPEGYVRPRGRPRLNEKAS